MVGSRAPTARMLIAIRLAFATPSGKRLATAVDRIEGGRNVLRASDLKGNGFETERAGYRLDLSQLQHGERVTDIAQDRETAQARNDLA